MPLMNWSGALSVGVHEIDEQHKKLVEMLNQLYEAMQKGQGKDVLGSLLAGLAQYTVKHFAAEERAMQRAGYADLAAHKVEHEALTKKVLDFKQRFDGGTSMITIELMNFLKGWLTSHIQGSDKKYGPVMNGVGIC
jgi:hemerythrin